MSRTGLPIMRPLFLEFPNGAADGGPIDLSTGNAFLLGPDLLIAQSPYPDELDDYSVAPCRQSAGTSIGQAQGSMEVPGAKVMIMRQLHSQKYTSTARLKPCLSSFGQAQFFHNSR